MTKILSHQEEFKQTEYLNLAYARISSVKTWLIQGIVSLDILAEISLSRSLSLFLDIFIGITGEDMKRNVFFSNTDAMNLKYGRRERKA